MAIGDGPRDLGRRAIAAAPITSMVTSRVAPSPSARSARQRLHHRPDARLERVPFLLFRIQSNARRALANRTTVSLVDVSPSTESRLF